MKSVKRIYKCTDCSDGPCFCIIPLESIPQYCIPNSYAVVAKTDDEQEDKGEACVDSVNWLPVETIYPDIGFSRGILKEILDA